jgi:hypothetical protein
MAKIKQPAQTTGLNASKQMPIVQNSKTNNLSKKKKKKQKAKNGEKNPLALGSCKIKSNKNVPVLNFNNDRLIIRTVYLK